jgi:hypothetical protein
VKTKIDFTMRVYGQNKSFAVCAHGRQQRSFFRRTAGFGTLRFLSTNAKPKKHALPLPIVPNRRRLMQIRAAAEIVLRTEGFDAVA